MRRYLETVLGIFYLFARSYSRGWPSNLSREVKLPLNLLADIPVPFLG